jgi:hypothetical protein
MTLDATITKILGSFAPPIRMAHAAGMKACI